MIGRKVSTAEAALDFMQGATDAQRIAVAIQLARAVTDPREAEGLLRLGRESTEMGQIMIRERFVSECG